MQKAWSKLGDEVEVNINIKNSVTPSQEGRSEDLKCTEAMRESAFKQAGIRDIL